MTQLSDIININISRETTAVARAAFNIPMFLATHAIFSERAREYTSLPALESDFGSSSDVYTAASRLFGQQIKPPKIVIGRRKADSVTGVVSATVSGNVSVTINGSTVSVASTAGSATATVASLATAVTAAAITGITFTDNLDGTFTVTSTGTLTVTAGSQIKLTYTATETYVDALAAVEQVNNTWYALAMESHVTADVEAMAGAIEARSKIFGTSSSDTTILDAATTTDIASVLKSDSYSRTFVMYSAEADVQFPECAWIGEELPETPGSNTWKFKTLAGVTVDTITDTQSAAATAKNCNTYQTVGGVNITGEGVVSSGEYIDVMIFVDWLHSRMQERIFSRLVNTKKIPFTQAGATLIENEIRAVLAEGIVNGGLAPNPKPTVDVPNVLSIDPNLRAMRNLQTLTFKGRLAGAIHALTVKGTVTV